MYEVIDYYTERGVLSAVDGEQPIEAVTDALHARHRPAGPLRRAAMTSTTAA